MNDNSHSELFPHWRCDRVLWLLIGLAAVLGLIYNAVILPGFAPDEPRHWEYIRLLVHQQTLPYLLPDGSEFSGAHTLHPPLYYLWLAPFYFVARGLPLEFQYHFVRLGSWVLTLAALPLIYQIACCAARGTEREKRNIARLVTAHIAFLPMVGMTSGSINNDSATLLVTSFFVWLLCVKFPGNTSLRVSAILGIVLAIGGWCKLNVLLCAGAALLFSYFAEDGFRAFLSSRIWLRFVTTVGVAGILLFPWLWHNKQVFGAWAPIPPAMPNPTGGDLSQIFNPDFPSYFAQASWGMLATMWSQKDWIPEAIRPAINCLFFAYVAVAVVALLVIKMRRRKLAGISEYSISMKDARPELALRIARWSSYGAFIANWIAVLQGALFLTWGWAEGGRYLLPSIFGIALIMALGWKQIVGTARLTIVLAVWCIALIMLNGVCVYWLLTYLNPTFGPKP